MAQAKKQFLVDENGEKTAVLLPIKEYEALTEAIQDLAITADRQDEPHMPVDAVKERLERKAVRRVVAIIEKLPLDEQDAVSERIAAELTDDAEWDARFDATTEEQWDKMEEMVRREIAMGNSAPIENAFPCNEYTAVIKQDGGWWIGWIEEAPGVNCQELTRDELLETLRITFKEILEINKAESIAFAGGDFQTERIAV